jgi:hypothetical protein
MSICVEAERHLVHDLCEVVKAVLAAHGIDPSSIELVAAYYGSDGTYRPLSGLVGLLDADPSKDRLPTLLLGLCAEDRLREAIRHHPDAEPLIALVDWPGLVYLRYGFDSEKLIVAARRALAGASVQPNLDPTAAVVSGRRLCRIATHWIKGRIGTMEGAAMVFEEAARSALPPHRTLLEPTLALTREHQAMMSRLVQLETTLSSPQSDEDVDNTCLAPTMERFEADWHALEATRAHALDALVRDPTRAASAWAEMNQAMADHYARVCEDLERMRSAIDALDAMLRRRFPSPATPANG